MLTEVRCALARDHGFLPRVHGLRLGRTTRPCCSFNFLTIRGCTTATNVRPLEVWVPTDWRANSGIRSGSFYFSNCRAQPFPKFLFVRIAIVVRDAKRALTSTTMCRSCARQQAFEHAQVFDRIRIAPRNVRIILPTDPLRTAYESSFWTSGRCSAIAS